MVVTKFTIDGYKEFVISGFLDPRTLYASALKEADNKYEMVHIDIPCEVCLKYRNYVSICRDEGNFFEAQKVKYDSYMQLSGSAKQTITNSNDPYLFLIHIHEQEERRIPKSEFDAKTIPHFAELITDSPYITFLSTFYLTSLVDKPLQWGTDHRLFRRNGHPADI